MQHKRNVILYIAMTLDGFIASPDGDLDFLEMEGTSPVDYGYDEFLKEIDTLIIGRKSYDKVLSMGFSYPHTERKVYILSRTERPDTAEGFHYYNGSLTGLVGKLKAESGLGIYCDGGSDVVHQLLQSNLIDELRIFVFPRLLGSGIPLFQPGRPENFLKLLSCKSYSNGVVALHYSNCK